MPTLEKLPRTIPVIAQPEAAARIAPLGFKNVTPISPGQTLATVGGKVNVTATAGALVGPPWSARQNGFVLREVGGERPASLYYEPHCGEGAAACQRMQLFPPLGLPVVYCAALRLAAAACSAQAGNPAYPPSHPIRTQTHTDFDAASVSTAGRVDVVVSPVLDVLLGGYALVRGDQDLVKVRDPI